MNDENPQERLYREMHEKYQAHYFDGPSLRYRERFIYKSMFQDIDLNGALVADLACGGGENSLALKRTFPSARSIGIDISAKAVAEFRRTTGGEGRVMDLTVFDPARLNVDTAMVVGGLHHCVIDLQQTLLNTPPWSGQAATS